MFGRKNQPKKPRNIVKLAVFDRDSLSVARAAVRDRLLNDRFRFFCYLTTPRFEVSMKLTSISTSAQSRISSLIFSTACVVLSLADSSR